MTIKLALAGNPNCGKTTMFNDLTGSAQYVGNWPGVTVEKKEGKLKQHDDVVIQDLPGIYSLSPYTLEERITRTYLVNEKPDAIIDIVDTSNLERNLYLTTQLLELGIPMVLALNMIDIVRRNGDTIDMNKLSKGLGCAVVETSAVKGEGSAKAAETAIAAATKNGVHVPSFFEGSVEHAIAHIEESIQSLVPAGTTRWYAVKLFERDPQVRKDLNLSAELLDHIEKHILDCENELEDDSESIITNQRYAFISRLLSTCYKKTEQKGGTISDKIDRIITNRLLGLPIFALIMYGVYWLSVGPDAWGTAATDFVNDVVVAEWCQGYAANFLESIGVAPWLEGLINDGIVGGVGAVLGFLPQMLTFFLLLSCLEDCGYMARVAFIMDRVFRRFGLSGKSFIPMLIATGCAVPGVLASRDRKSVV